MTRAADRSRSPNGRNFDAVSGDDDPQYRMLCSNLSVGNIAGLDSSGSGHSRGNNSSVDFGILITLNHGVCELRFCSDHNFEDIHPNCFAPAALQNVKKLGGGGSGVAVFEGSHPHPQLGDLVMKHGGDKDMEEFFALATIAEELTLRSSNNPRAAEELRQRIPEFKMLYIRYVTLY